MVNGGIHLPGPNAKRGGICLSVNLVLMLTLHSEANDTTFSVTLKEFSGYYSLLT